MSFIVLFRYGLGEFVLVAPDEGVESLTSQAQAKLMLSSISVALANTGWCVLLLDQCSACSKYLSLSLSLSLSLPPAQLQSLFRFTQGGGKCMWGCVKGEV